MKKKLAIAIIGGTLLLGTAFTSFASGDTAIKSHGTLRVKNASGSETVTIYASDIQYLQDELDALFAEVEAIGK